MDRPLFIPTHGGGAVDVRAARHGDGAGSDHFGTLELHAAAIIHHQADGNRNIGAREFRNLLRLAIFKDLEIVPGEAGDISAFGLFDAHIE